MYCAPDVIALDLVPVSKQHLFTLSLFVFIVKISHCRDKRKKRNPSADTVNYKKESPEV